MTEVSQSTTEPDWVTVEKDGAGRALQLTQGITLDQLIAGLVRARADDPRAVRGDEVPGSAPLLEAHCHHGAIRFRFRAP